MVSAPAAPAAASSGRSRRAASWAISLAVAAALLYWSLRGIDWARVWAMLTAARWRFVLAACAITAGSYVLRAVRWRILLNAEGSFRVAPVFWANMAGYLANNLLPARGGELVRTVLISRQSSLSNAFVLTTALSERMMDVIAVLVWALAALAGLENKPQWMTAAARGLAGIAVGVLLATALLPRFAEPIERLLKWLPLPRGARDFALHSTGQALLGLRAFHDARRAAGFALLSAVVWGCDACAMMMLGQALGVPVSFRIGVLLLTGLALGGSLPSTPGYVGIYQFVAVTVLPPFGVTRDAALAYILLVQATAYAISIAFGLPGLLQLRKTGPERERLKLRR